MGTLPYTIGFGLILTLMTWFSFNRMAQEVSSTSKSLHAITEARTTFTQQISDTSKETYYSLTGESDEDDVETPEGDNDQQKKTSKKRAHRTTPKLHIRDIFLNEGSPLQETELKLFQNLLRNLYGSLPIFSVNGDQTAQILELFEEVRTTFLSWGDKHRLSRPEHIGDISFTGPNAHQKQFILNMILRGGNAEFIIGKRCVLPKLNNYISAIRRKTCMSVYKAPVPILLALFQDPSIVSEVLAYRTQVYKKLTSKKNEKSEEEISPETLSTEFRSAFESKIPSGIDPQYIDFTVTKGKPIDLLRT
jgi:hypothetical protein